MSRCMETVKKIKRHINNHWASLSYGSLIDTWCRGMECVSFFLLEVNIDNNIDTSKSNQIDLLENLMPPASIMSKSGEKGKGEEELTIQEMRAKLGWTPPYDPRFPNTNQTR